MGNTSFYVIPYPEQYDIPDGAAQMKAIADKIEAILKGGFTIPGGDLVTSGGGLVVGDASAVKDAYLTRYQGKRRMSTTPNDWALYQIVMPDRDTPFSLEVYNGTDAVNVTWLGRLGFNGKQITINGTDVNRPLPFATYATSIPVISWAAAASSGTTVVTYPVGRFTQAPVVQVQIIHSGNYFCWVHSGPAPSASAVTIGARHYAGAVGAASLPVYLIATQMTPTSATG